MFFLHFFSFQYHQEEEGYYGSEQKSSVKIRSLQYIKSGEDQKDDQEDEDAGELEDVFFERHTVRFICNLVLF